VNTTGLVEPMTVRMYLSQDSQGPDLTELIAKSIRESGIAGSAIKGVRRLSTSAVQAVHDEVNTVADGFLDLKLGDVLVSGWRKYTALVEAAERTQATPGSKEVVVLATHQVKSTHHPSIDLLVDEVKVYTLVFELTVEFDITGIVAVVQRGKLVSLRGGPCELTVTLTLEGKQVLPPRKAQVDLLLIVPLNPAISLLHHRPAVGP
jgi:hypothetical protein